MGGSRSFILASLCFNEETEGCLPMAILLAIRAIRAKPGMAAECPSPDRRLAAQHHQPAAAPSQRTAWP